MVNLPFKCNLREELLSLLHNQHALFFQTMICTQHNFLLAQLSRKAEINNVGRFGHENFRDLAMCENEKIEVAENTLIKVPNSTCIGKQHEFWTCLGRQKVEMDNNYVQRFRAAWTESCT